MGKLNGCIVCKVRRSDKPLVKPLEPLFTFHPETTQLALLVQDFPLEQLQFFHIFESNLNGSLFGSLCPQWNQSTASFLMAAHVMVNGSAITSASNRWWNEPEAIPLASCHSRGSSPHIPWGRQSQREGCHGMC